MEGVNCKLSSVTVGQVIDHRNEKPSCKLVQSPQGRFSFILSTLCLWQNLAGSCAICHRHSFVFLGDSPLKRGQTKMLQCVSWGPGARIKQRWASRKVWKGEISAGIWHRRGFSLLQTDKSCCDATWWNLQVVLAEYLCENDEVKGKEECLRAVRGMAKLPGLSPASHRPVSQPICFQKPFTFFSKSHYLTT